MTKSWISLLAVAVLLIGGICWWSCRDAAEAERDSVPAWMKPMLDKQSGGDTTVENDTPNAFALMLANLDGSRSDRHFAGNSLFTKNWVAAPASPKGRDGLGPLFNARSCSGCHFKDGRGRPAMGPDEEPSALLIRTGRSDSGARAKGFVDPNYGGQIQNFALPGLKPEAKVRYETKSSVFTFADGETLELSRPFYRLESLGYGPLAEGVKLGPRVPPQVFGLGLLEAIPTSVLTKNADPDDANGDGISGRPNRVFDRKLKKTVMGRFGWKAGQPSVAQQSAAAFNGDMGLTTSLFPKPNHTPAQKACEGLPNGGSPEVNDRSFELVEFYMLTLAPPARRAPTSAFVRRGAALFHAAKCDACHLPELRTGTLEGFPELSQQKIHAYTDLLLHDMGAGLGDGVREADAAGSEWRTAPLWGLGLVARVRADGDEGLYLLHDGRAKTVAEAIAWHGGEAESARGAFRQMNREDRAALIAFVMDL